MKILIDIGHPGHVHYFRNLYKMMSENGHEFLFIAREREVIKSLLDFYKIPYFLRGKGKDSAFGKMAYMFYADFLILKKSIKFKPVIFISFCTPYAAQVSAVLRIPYIALTDTEHTDGTHKKFTFPFAQAIITPSCYLNDLGKKQIRINCTVESFYLHSKQYKPAPSIFEVLGISRSTQYVILRFISWNAFHDVNQHGLSIEQKREIIHLLEKKYRVFISSEREIEAEFKPYQIQIPPERMHDALAFSSLFVGESGTMASESALLGVPVVYVNSLPLMGYLKLEQEYEILKHFKNGNGVIEYVAALIQNPELLNETKAKRNQMTKDFIDPTAFLVWFIENYPESKMIMHENPDYQYMFK